MKQTFVASFIILSLLPVSAFAQNVQSSIGATAQAGISAASLRVGTQSNDVKELQDILKTDPSIYPQGLSTGYFGTLTEDAVKRLQSRYGIPQTGVLDDATRAVIFPSPSNLTLQIVAPNGGEAWDRSVAQLITWKATFAPWSDIMPMTTNGGQSAPSGVAQERKVMMPFYRKGALELTRDSDPNFARRIASVDLLDRSYRWVIGGDVPSGTDYRVRVTYSQSPPCFGGGIDSQGAMNDQTNLSYPIVPRPCPLMATRPATDSSDNTFTITGTSVPPTGTIAELRAKIASIEKTIADLTAQVERIKTILSQYQ